MSLVDCIRRAKDLNQVSKRVFVWSGMLSCTGDFAQAIDFPLSSFLIIGIPLAVFPTYQRFY